MGDKAREEALQDNSDKRKGGRRTYDVDKTRGHDPGSRLTRAERVTRRRDDEGRDEGSRWREQRLGIETRAGRDDATTKKDEGGGDHDSDLHEGTGREGDDGQDKSSGNSRTTHLGDEGGPRGRRRS